MKPEYLEKTTHLMPAIDHFYNVKLFRVQLAMGNNNQTHIFVASISDEIFLLN